MSAYLDDLGDQLRAISDEIKQETVKKTVLVEAGATLGSFLNDILTTSFKLPQAQTVNEAVQKKIDAYTRDMDNLQQQIEAAERAGRARRVDQCKKKLEEDERQLELLQKQMVSEDALNAIGEKKRAFEERWSSVVELYANDHVLRTFDELKVISPTDTTSTGKKLEELKEFVNVNLEEVQRDLALVQNALDQKRSERLEVVVRLEGAERDAKNEKWGSSMVKRLAREVGEEYLQQIQDELKLQTTDGISKVWEALDRMSLGMEDMKKVIEAGKEAGGAQDISSIVDRLDLISTQLDSVQESTSSDSSEDVLAQLRQQDEVLKVMTEEVQKVRSEQSRVSEKLTELLTTSSLGGTAVSPKDQAEVVRRAAQTEGVDPTQVAEMCSSVADPERGFDYAKRSEKEKKQMQKQMKQKAPNIADEKLDKIANMVSRMYLIQAAGLLAFGVHMIEEDTSEIWVERSKGNPPAAGGRQPNRAHKACFRLRRNHTHHLTITIVQENEIVPFMVEDLHKIRINGRSAPYVQQPRIVSEGGKSMLQAIVKWTWPMEWTKETGKKRYYPLLEYEYKIKDYDDWIKAHQELQVKVEKPDEGFKKEKLIKKFKELRELIPPWAIKASWIALCMVVKASTGVSLPDVIQNAAD